MILYEILFRLVILTEIFFHFGIVVEIMRDMKLRIVSEENAQEVITHRINLMKVTRNNKLSHFSQVLGVGYMNQKRVTPDRAHRSTLSTHSY